MTFTSTTTGTSGYEWCADGTTDHEETDWRLSDLSTPIYAGTVADAIYFAFLDTWQAGQTRAYDYQIRNKTLQGSWGNGCGTFVNDSGNAVTSYLSIEVALGQNESGTIFEFRYRYRNSSSCDTGSPDPWSPVAEGKIVSGTGGGGGPTTRSGEYRLLQGLRISPGRVKF